MIQGGAGVEHRILPIMHRKIHFNTVDVADLDWEFSARALRIALSDAFSRLVAERKLRPCYQRQWDGARRQLRFRRHGLQVGRREKGCARSCS